MIGQWAIVKGDRLVELCDAIAYHCDDGWTSIVKYSAKKMNHSDWTYGCCSERVEHCDELENCCGCKSNHCNRTVSLCYVTVNHCDE